jgi:hypothetical protein
MSYCACDLLKSWKCYGRVHENLRKLNKKIHVIPCKQKIWGFLHGEKSAKLAHLTLFKFFIERGRQFFLSLCLLYYNGDVAALQGHQARVGLCRGRGAHLSPSHSQGFRHREEQRENTGRHEDCHRRHRDLRSKLQSQEVHHRRRHRIQRWARDIVIRDGLLSSVWADLSTIMSARDATIHDSHGACIPTAEFLRLPNDAEDGDTQAALRWAVADFLVSDSV